MILDKLIEKKEMLAFIDFRRSHLLKEKRGLSELKEKSKISSAKDKLHGRIEELNYIKKVVNGNKVKELSKQLSQWQKKYREDPKFKEKVRSRCNKRQRYIQEMWDLKTDDEKLSLMMDYVEERL